MIKLTTPTFTLRLPETVDLTEVEHIIFSMSQNNPFSSHGSVLVEKTENDLTVETHSIVVTLTQTDTLLFVPDVKGKMQLNLKYADGKRAASRPKDFEITENLHEEVIP